MPSIWINKSQRLQWLMRKGWYSGLNTQYIPGDSTYYVHLEHLQRLVIQVVCPGHFNPKKCPADGPAFFTSQLISLVPRLPSWFQGFWWILRDNPNELCQLWKTGVQLFLPHPMWKGWISSFSDMCFLLVELPTSKNLVGGWPTPLKNMSSSVGITIPNIWKVIIQPCSKPPTS